MSWPVGSPRDVRETDSGSCGDGIPDGERVGMVGARAMESECPPSSGHDHVWRLLLLPPCLRLSDPGQAWLLRYGFRTYLARRPFDSLQPRSVVRSSHNAG